MEVIIGGRQSGKTQYLIDMIRKDRHYVMIVRSATERRRVEQNYKIPDLQVITVDQVRAGYLHQSAYARIVIDGLDPIMYQLLQIPANGQIEAVSLNAQLTRMAVGRDARTGI